MATALYQLLSFLTSLTSLRSSVISARIDRNSDSKNPESMSLISSCGQVDSSDTANVGNPLGHLCRANRISSILFLPCQDLVVAGPVATQAPVRTLSSPALSQPKLLSGPCRRRPCRNPSSCQDLVVAGPVATQAPVRTLSSPALSHPKLLSGPCRRRSCRNPSSCQDLVVAGPVATQAPVRTLSSPALSHPKLLSGPCRRRPCRIPSFFTSSHSYSCCFAVSVSLAQHFVNLTSSIECNLLCNILKSM